ncbi:MAG: protease modulator HflC, partial [Candidatus Zixiibacteriota bacterium]
EKRNRKECDQLKRKILIGVLILAVIIGSGLVFYQVDEREYVVITRFGNPIKAVLTAGLKLKWPDPIESVNRYDNRLMTYDMGEIEFLTKDKKNVMIDAYMVWRIKDPIQYMKTIKDKFGAEARLADILSSEVGVGVGRYDLSSLISVEKEAMKLDKMMAEVKEQCDAKAAPYGIEVEDVRMSLLNFPERNKLSVFRRMRAERERIAKAYRSEGTEKSLQIRAEADKQEKIILSEAYEKAQKIKGDGEAQAIKIYANAYERDLKFYELVRTLEAYEKFLDDETTVVLTADSDLLKFINSANPDLLKLSKLKRQAASSTKPGKKEVESSP